MYVWRRRFPNSLAIIIHTFNYYHEKGLTIMDFPNPFLSQTPEGSSVITIVLCSKKLVAEVIAIHCIRDGREILDTICGSPEKN